MVFRGLRSTFQTFGVGGLGACRVQWLTIVRVFCFGFQGFSGEGAGSQGFHRLHYWQTCGKLPGPQQLLTSCIHEKGLGFRV